MRYLAHRPCAEIRGENTFSYGVVVRVIEIRIGGDKQHVIANITQVEEIERS
jgi:hypothetical protein